MGDVDRHHDDQSEFRQTLDLDLRSPTSAAACALHALLSRRPSRLHESESDLVQLSSRSARAAARLAAAAASRRRVTSRLSDDVLDYVDRTWSVFSESTSRHDHAACHCMIDLLAADV